MFFGRKGTSRLEPSVDNEEQRAGLNASDAATVAFDEGWYLVTYPDVAAAVGRGEYSSGRDHFFRFGRDEGRKGRSATHKPGPESPLPEVKRRHEGAYYLTPDDLGPSGFRLRRTLVIGTCLAEA